MTYRLTQEFSFFVVDEISYLISCKNLFYEQWKIQEYLKPLVKWMDDWRLCLVVHKCLFKVFSRHMRKRLKENLFNFKIHRDSIKFDQSPKLLGIKFDKYMNGSAHVKEIKI